MLTKLVTKSRRKLSIVPKVSSRNLSSSKQTRKQQPRDWQEMLKLRKRKLPNVKKEENQSLRMMTMARVACLRELPICMMLESSMLIKLIDNLESVELLLMRILDSLVDLR